MMFSQRLAIQATIQSLFLLEVVQEVQYLHSDLLAHHRVPQLQREELIKRKRSSSVVWWCGDVAVIWYRVVHQIELLPQ